MSKLSRRAALQIVAGTAVAAPVSIVQASPHPMAFPLTHGCDLELIELRRAIDAYQAAVRHEMSIEGRPGHAEAVAESDARQLICEALADAIYTRKPVEIRDVVLRAECLRQYYFGGHRECLKPFDGDDPDREKQGEDYAFAKLYEAAVLLAGGDND